MRYRQSPERVRRRLKESVEHLSAFLVTCPTRPTTRSYHRLMTMIAHKGDCASDSSNLEPATALFRSLSDPTRLAIIRELASKEARITDLVAFLGLAQSTVSAHVGCLRECGLVRGRQVGRQTFYSLGHPELLDLLATAEGLLSVTGNAVGLCPNYAPAAASGREGGTCHG